MLPVNFNHLYYFWVVAKEGSITSAGRRLLLTQSTLSLQLQHLEKSVGKKLLSRGRHGVALTPEGRRAFEYAERTFSQAEEFARSLASDQPMPPPALKLGVTGAVSRRIVLRILSFLREAAPRGRVRLAAGEAEDLRARLARNGVDLVVSEQDLAAGMGPDFRSRQVARLPLYFVAAPAVKALIRRFPADLARVPLLLRGPENPVRKEVDHFLYHHKVAAAVEAETEDVDFLRALLLQGRGASVLDAISIEDDLSSRRLLKLHPTPLAARQSVWFLYRRHHRGEPVLQELLDALMDSFQLTV